MILRTAALIALLALPQLASSQGAYLNSGESGVALSGSFSVNEDATAISGGFGYSASTIIDIGFAAGYVSFDGDLSAIGISPSLAVYVLK